MTILYARFKFFGFLFSLLKGIYNTFPIFHKTFIIFIWHLVCCFHRQCFVKNWKMIFLVMILEQFFWSLTARQLEIKLLLHMPFFQIVIYILRLQGRSNFLMKLLKSFMKLSCESRKRKNFLYSIWLIILEHSTNLRKLMKTVWIELHIYFVKKYKKRLHRYSNIQTPTNYVKLNTCIQNK